MHTLAHAPWVHFWIGNYNAVDTLTEEAIVLANEKGALMWKACGIMHRGILLALTGKAANAIPMITSAMKLFQSTSTTLWVPSFFSYQARAYAELGRLNDAWRCI